ncbi:MAG: DNA primase [Motilibacteraceae bacterium]
MAGRIRDEDVQLVKERADIAEVIGEQVTLRRAGAGRLKGLCPFHDEKTPSFNVNTSLRLYKCFGCGEGGDVIRFVMETEHLSFAEAVEKLAVRAGVQLRYEESGSGAPAPPPGLRTRLLDAHAAAAQFYAEHLRSPEAVVGRRFLAERGFDQAAAERFGVGWAPTGWDDLVRHLKGRGFTDAELTTGGLARQGSRGLTDFFRGRLLWPIRSNAGDVVGFGARRLLEEDRLPAKYVNTPETPVYRKSQVLYGLDLARKEIARQRQAVVVEGYTDVMACHLAGVETAVASCGTAFGDEHIKLLRRLLVDDDRTGEVVFTFDGDAAGQKAALKAFTDDQKFVTQTFVAVEPNGLDPCELRQHHGDAAVRELVARRVPLFEFVIRTSIAKHDLDHPEGRVAALGTAAPIVAGIKDPTLRPEYARTVAGWLGMEVEAVLAAVRRAQRQLERGGPAPGAPRGSSDHLSENSSDRLSEHAPPAVPKPSPNDPDLLVEREALKVAVQSPQLAGDLFDLLDEACFTHPAYAAVRAVVEGAGGCGGGVEGETWATALLDAARTPQVRDLVLELAVEPLRAGAADVRYAGELCARLEERAVARRIQGLRSRLQRLDPVAQAEEQMAVFAELVSLEHQRRVLQERAVGAI